MAERVRSVLERHGLPGLRAVIAAVLFACTLTLTFGNLVPARARRAAREQDLTEELARNRALELRLLETDRRAERLLRDPLANERVLRDRYRMSGEGELVVR